jgi:hypothetical protein
MISWTEMLPGSFTPSPETSSILSNSARKPSAENILEAMAAWLMNARFIAEESRDFTPLDIAGRGMPSKVAQVLGLANPHADAFAGSLLSDIATFLKSAGEMAPGVVLSRRTRPFSSTPGPRQRIIRSRQPTRT